MKRDIVRNAGYTLMASVSPLLRTVRKDAVRILAYHTVPDAVQYRRQLTFLRDHYSLISNDQLREAVFGAVTLPERSVLITFDDGDRSVLEAAAPLHRELNVPAVLFVVTDLIDTSTPFWWDRVVQHHRRQGGTTAEGRAMVNRLKSVPNAERLTYLDTMEELSMPQLTRSELLNLQSAGIAIANHTATHPLIDRCTVSELEAELDRSITYLSDIPGAYPKVFAYPNGNSSPELDVILERKGIELAFLFNHDLAHTDQPPLHMSRIRVNTNDPLPEFRSKVDGLHPLLYQLRR